MPHLHLYMSATALAGFAAGEASIYSRLATAFRSAGYEVEPAEDTAANRSAAVTRAGHAIFQMVEPPNPRALCLRRAYHYPFWRLENTNERWRFDVALAPFKPDEIDPVQAKSFTDRWRAKLTGGRPASRQGLIFMPLQGRLLDHRSFQSQSPAEMIETTLAQDPKRRVVATLHPSESYGGAERAMLRRLESKHRRFHLATDSAGLVESCDYIVTQNSSMALTGYLFGKRPVLFAGSDFHHIAASVLHIGIADAFRLATEPPPEVDRYLYWFWQVQSINAGRSDVTAQILARAARHGWPPSGE